MTRWIWKRWALALVAAAGMVTAADAQSGNKAADKDTDVIVLKFQGQPDRKVKVVKTSRQPDGKVATEVKDIATGETFTLIDSAPSGADKDKATPPTPPAPPAKDVGLPRAKSRTNDPLTPDPMRPPTATAAKPTPAALPVADPVPEPAKRPGPLARLFGKKPTPAPAMPAAGANVPPFAPVPVSTKAPSLPGASIPGEPPRAMPPKALPLPPVTPPTPVIAAPLPIPTIPPLPGGSQSRAGAVNVILPVGYIPAEVALSQDIRPHVNTLRDALAPSARVTATRALAGGRHASTDQVKAILFQTAQADPCPQVKACCITELTKLGYFTPAFAAHVKSACDDENADVEAAAKAAVVKMTPKK